MEEHRQRVQRWEALKREREELRESEGYKRLFEQINAQKLDTAARDLRAWLFGQDATIADHRRAIQILRDMETSRSGKILESFDPKERKAVLLEMCHQTPPR